MQQKSRINAGLQLRKAVYPACLPPRVYKQGTVQNCRMQIKSALQIQQNVLHGLCKRTASVCTTPSAIPMQNQFCRGSADLVACDLGSTNAGLVLKPSKVWKTLQNN